MTLNCISLCPWHWWLTLSNSCQFMVLFYRVRNWALLFFNATELFYENMWHLRIFPFIDFFSKTSFKYIFAISFKCWWGNFANRFVYLWMLCLRCLLTHILFMIVVVIIITVRFVNIILFACIGCWNNIYLLIWPHIITVKPLLWSLAANQSHANQTCSPKSYKKLITWHSQWIRTRCARYIFGNSWSLLGADLSNFTAQP